MDPNGGIGPMGPRLDTNNTAGQMPSDASVGMTIANPGAPLASPIIAPIDQGAEVPQQPAPPQYMQSEAPMAPQVQPTPPPANIETDLLVPAPSGPDNKKVILIAVASVVVCIVLGIAMFFVGFSSGKSKGRAEADAAWQLKEAERQKAEEQTGDDSADTAEALELGDLEEPNYIDETVEGEIGEQLKASDGLVLKVTNIERNFKTEDTNYKLDPSKELIKINFLIGNVTKDKPKDINSFGFRLENSAKAKLVPENITEYTDKFDTVKLDPGAQTKGSIVYLVNKDEKPLTFIREQVYRITGQNREVTTRTSVVVAK